MISSIRNPKDFWSGLIFTVAGLAGAVIGYEYSMGTMREMGPGYFPRILSILLVLLGVAVMIRSFVRAGAPISGFATREVFLVILAIVTFAATVRGAGFAFSTMATVIISGYASPKFKIIPYLLLSFTMTLFCILVFVKGLGLALPIIGPWLKF